MDQDGQREKWRTIAEVLADRVRSGELAQGQRIPSVVDLARTYEVAVTTVRKAVDALKAAGTLRGDSGSGTYVAGPAPESIGQPVTPLDRLRAEVADLQTRVDRLEQRDA